MLCMSSGSELSTQARTDLLNCLAALAEALCFWESDCGAFWLGFEFFFFFFFLFFSFFEDFSELMAAAVKSAVEVEVAIDLPAAVRLEEEAERDTFVAAVMENCCAGNAASAAFTVAASGGMTASVLPPVSSSVECVISSVISASFFSDGEETALARVFDIPNSCISESSGTDPFFDKTCIFPLWGQDGAFDVRSARRSCIWGSSLSPPSPSTALYEPSTSFFSSGTSSSITFPAASLSTSFLIMSNLDWLDLLVLLLFSCLLFFLSLYGFGERDLPPL
mmetsp:Transcript_29224/g.43330  ORF Transcript_29224/g.43330 Transcript_29224/m.43330 type:complete len:279 (-) Transcript_29224:451-1287(-)